MTFTINNPSPQRYCLIWITRFTHIDHHEAGMRSIEEKAATKLGIKPDDFNSVFTRAREDIENQLGSAASSHSRLLYFQRTLEYLGLRSQVVLSLEFEQTYCVTFSRRWNFEKV